MDDLMRTCTTCFIEKSISDFSLRSTITKQRHRVCKECHKHTAKRHYRENAETYKSRAKEWAGHNPETRRKVARVAAKLRLRQMKTLAVEYKGGKCVDCLGVFPLACYDFHHVDPTQKDLHISNALSAKGFDFCKEELDKCILLCSNCHRIRHHGSE